MTDLSCACSTIAECTHQAVTQSCSVGKITALALADAVNPCAIAVLTMVLIAIITKNPEKRRHVLYSGIAFTSAVFVGYLFYGTILVQFFNSFVLTSRTYAPYFYNGLAVAAMIIGALQIKDYFSYVPGGIATEMPLWMRPYAKLTIQKITSPTGAFFIGLIVTVFLLPCTMGPYVVAAGIIAEKGFLGSLPWLSYYNFLFVLPMIFITMLVFWGYSKVDDVSGWKERNIKILHLIAGSLMFIVGLSLLLGWL